MAEVSVEKRDNGLVFRVNQGDTVVIRLEENLSTGYSWHHSDIERSIVELIDSEYAEPTKERTVGGGGVRTIRFRARTAGDTWIRVTLRRLWEPEDKALEGFEIGLHIG